MAVLYCFTSTGNSLYAARKIADAISAEVLPVTYEATTTGEDVVGFVFPIMLHTIASFPVFLIVSSITCNPVSGFVSVFHSGDFCNHLFTNLGRS